jgi:hypothetical protein
MNSWLNRLNINTHKDSTTVISGLTSKPDIQIGARFGGILVSMIFS